VSIISHGAAASGRKKTRYLISGGVQVVTASAHSEISVGLFAMHAGETIHSQPSQFACSVVARPSTLSASTPGN
jgi:hypothetical protein